MTKPEEIDDMLSELSTPGFQEDDFAAQKRYIESLLNGKAKALTVDKEEMDL